MPTLELNNVYEAFVVKLLPHFSVVVSADFGSITLPQDIVIDKEKGVLFVADRLNGRVQSFLLDGTPAEEISNNNITNVYSVDVHGTLLHIPIYLGSGFLAYFRPEILLMISFLGKLPKTLVGQLPAIELEIWIFEQSLEHIYLYL